MNFALDEDHRFLRDLARTFVAKEIDLAPLLIPGATVANASYDATWQKIVDLGWPGLVVPEVYGGSGMTCLDLAMIVGEMGRGLVPSPFFGTLAGTWTLLRAASDAQKDRLLPGIAAGTVTTALAIAGANGAAGGTECDARATERDGAYVLDGSASFVVDAASATTLVVAARDGERRRFFVVDATHAGVATRVLSWRDVTRQVCDVRFDAVPAEPLAVDADEAWPWIRDRLLLVLATESAAGIEHVLETTVAYAKERVAFGRSIGSYQSIKHALADTFGASECAGVLALYAAWALSEEALDASTSVAMAQSYASDAYVAATERSIQVFGALGFSWEMENHLYFKRARANATLLGRATEHRERIVAALEPPAA